VHDGRKGGDSIGSLAGSVVSGSTLFVVPRPPARTGGGGGGEKASGSILVSWWMISVRESGWSHGGGTMFARRCFLRRRASQRGMSLRRGGRSSGVAP